MKALIWIFSFLGVFAINSFVKTKTGYAFGEFIIFLLWWIVSRYLCRLWDKYELKKEAKKRGLSPFEYIKHDIDDSILEQCEILHENEDELETYLIQKVKEKKLTKIYLDIIYERYVALNEPNIDDQLYLGKETYNDEINHCNSCGEKLIEDSKFCRKCGAEIKK